MIIKVGVDVVQIPRIASLFDKFGSRFCRKILHSSEMQVFDALKIRHMNYLAKRFAAKEAIAKAFGVGIGNFLSFGDIVVNKDRFGAPSVAFQDSVLLRLLPQGYSKCEINLSISDDDPIVVACAIAVFSF